MDTATVDRPAPAAGGEPDPDPEPPAARCVWCVGTGKQEGAAGPDPCGACRGTGRRPFDRAEHCWAIAAGGGTRTASLYGSTFYRTIGKAGARATITRHGLGTYLGIVTAKGWTGSRRPDLAADLAIGDYLAA
jgi:hypothetical protein